MYMSFLFVITLFKVDMIKGPLAQAVEHLTFNQVVSGSSPEWLKKEKSLETLKFQGFFNRELYEQPVIPGGHMRFYQDRVPDH